MPIEATFTNQATPLTNREENHPLGNYFLVTIETEFVETFKLLIKYLTFLFKNPDLALVLYKEKYGEPDENVLHVINKFSMLKHDLENRGITIPYNNLCYRYVASEDSLTVEAIINNTYATGGKDPNSNKPWIHVAGSWSQLSDFMNRYVGRSGVILLYDQAKLTPITEGDMQAFPFQAYYYGQKPKEGLSLNDALLGLITISA